MILLSVVRTLRDKIAAARDPIRFARGIGVDVHPSVRFYGVSRGMFGSEPWLIRIGANCHITAGVTFVTHDGGTLILRSEEPTLEWTAPISIGERVYIGVKTIILPGVTIGNRCIIGAGSVVTNNIPSNSVAAGVPARVIASTDEYMSRMSAKSLGFGHLSPADKEEALKAHFMEKGWFSHSGNIDA
jgi:acetyltransferase-like isoleucine patch superfamily enzyme